MDKETHSEGKEAALQKKQQREEKARETKEQREREVEELEERKQIRQEEQEEREEGPLPWRSQLERAPVGVNLERSQELELHVRKLTRCGR